MTTKLYIPKTIRVGFQSRQDTFTKKLAYVIYIDDAGKVRKETSWNSWRDKKIDAVDYENKPRKGFMFNKGVQRDGYWGSGRSVIRVYDDRDFEFEISVTNLIGILMHADVSKREIDEECVFAWNGTELVLLPVTSVEYQAAVAYTDKQAQKISAKDLKVGATYLLKKEETKVAYLGYHQWYEVNHHTLYTSTVDKSSTFDWSESRKMHGYGYYNSKSPTQTDLVLQVDKGKKHIFVDLSSNKIMPLNAPQLAYCIDDECIASFAERIDNFQQSVNASKVASRKFVDTKLDLKALIEYVKVNKLDSVKVSVPYRAESSIEVLLQPYYYDAQAGTYQPRGLNFRERRIVSEPSGLFTEAQLANINAVSKCPKTVVAAWPGQQYSLSDAAKLEVPPHNDWHTQIPTAWLREAGVAEDGIVLEDAISHRNWGHDKVKLDINKLQDLLNNLGYGQHQVILENGLVARDNASTL